MNISLTEKLINDFPNLYKGAGGDPAETCMAFYFECDDGWYDIIYELSSKLEPSGVVAMQVKEKYGELRFYIGEGSDEIFELIDETTKRSRVTCEKCGKPGKIRGEYWLKTLCDDCDK